MAMKEILSRSGFFGTTDHYDPNGRYVGKTEPVGMIKGTQPISKKRKEVYAKTSARFRL